MSKDFLESRAETIQFDKQSNDDLSIAGALQVALDSLTDDPNAALKDSTKGLSDVTMDPADPKLVGVGYAYPEAAEGHLVHGFPGWIRQADILRPIAPVLTVRDDTFTIRAYGDTRNADGKILAQAWCEAIVRRTREFVDTQDEADSIEPPTSLTNQINGRKYDITSFRWLAPEEI